VADTGIAGPAGGTDEKPVGLVYLHVETESDRRGFEFQFPGDRDSIRRRATVTALHLVRRLLTQNRDKAAR
jgi:nicotinamide-nucleotide amidase